MFNADQLEQVEISIKEAKEKIALMDSVNRLLKNRDFKKVIDIGYLENESVRLVHLKADFNMQDDANRQYIERAIDSVGFFKTYLSTIYQQGNAALGALQGHEKTREEILADDLVGEQ